MKGCEKIFTLEEVYWSYSKNSPQHLSGIEITQIYRQ